jgi:hypothetical protein
MKYFSFVFFIVACTGGPKQKTLQEIQDSTEAANLTRAKYLYDNTLHVIENARDKTQGGKELLLLQTELDSLEKRTLSAKFFLELEEHKKASLLAFIKRKQAKEQVKH